MRAAPRRKKESPTYDGVDMCLKQLLVKIAVPFKELPRRWGQFVGQTLIRQVLGRYLGPCRVRPRKNEVDWHSGHEEARSSDRR